MTATSMVHVRVDEHLKTQATETLAAMDRDVAERTQHLPSGFLLVP